MDTNEELKFLRKLKKNSGGVSRVGKILTAWDFPHGKSRYFPGWEILSKLAKLGNTGK